MGDVATDEGYTDDRLESAVKMKKAARSLLATLLVGAALAVLLWFGDIHKVLAQIARFQRGYLLWFLLVLAAYEVVRGLLWYVLLRTLTVRAPPRTRTFAFAAGEAAKFLPTGAYLQNYMLQRFADIDFVRSSAATTWMILAEILVALLGVVVFGVGGWSGPLRLVMVIGMAAGIWAVRVYLTRAHGTPRSEWAARNKALSKALDGIRRFREGAAALSRPRVMGITLLLTLAYVILAGAGLYIVVRGLGITQVSFWQAVAVNCFGLAFYVILGSLEAAEVGAFIGIGMNKSAAVSAILVARGLSVGGTLVMAVLVLAVLHDEWRPMHS